MTSVGELKDIVLFKSALINVIFLPEIYSTISRKGLKDDTGGFNLPSVVDSMDIGITETEEKRKCCVVM